MTNDTTSSRFGKRANYATPVNARANSIDDQTKALANSRTIAGGVAWWTITAVAIALSAIVAGNSGSNMDILPSGPMVMLLSDIQFTEDLALSRFRVLNFDLFGVYSSRYVFLGSVVAGLWGVFALLLIWIRQKRISWLGVALVTGAAVLAAFTNSASGHSRQAATQRFTTVKTIEHELGIVSADASVTDKWLRTIRQNAAGTPIAVRVAKASQQARVDIKAEDIRFADAVAYEQTKFVAAQYWAIKGDAEKASAYLPVDLERIVFHPESRIAVAQRMCWLSEVTGRPATDEAVIDQLCAKAGIWRAGLIVTRISKQVVLVGLPIFTLSILVFVGLGIRLQLIRNRRREVPYDI